MLANAFFDIRTRTESARRRRAALVAILAIGVAIQIYRLLSPPAVPPNKPLDARARRFLEDVTRDPRPQGGSPKRR